MKRFFAAISGLLVLALLITGCQDPVSPPPAPPTGDLTVAISALALSGEASRTLEMGSSLDVLALLTITPATATEAVSWTSTVPEVATVASGVISPVSVGTTVIRASAPDPTIYAEITLTVVPVGGLASLADKFKFFNQAGVNPDSTQELPALVEGKVIITNVNTADSLSYIDANKIEKNSVLYFDQALTGDFRIKARVRYESTNTSSSRGAVVGAITMGTPGSITGGVAGDIFALMFKRARGDVVSYYHKNNSGGSIGTGNPQISQSLAISEYIYEVKRDATGITFTLFNSKTGAEIGTNTVAYNAGALDQLKDGFTASTPMYPVFAVGGGVATISNIKIFSGTVGSETTLFETAEIAGSPVPVTGIELTAPSRNSYTNASSLTYQYVNAHNASEVVAGLQLTASVLPASADVATYTFSSSDTNIAEISASGLLTVKTAGDVTITATSTENSFQKTWNAHFTNGVVTSTAINIAGLDQVGEGATITLTASFTPADTTDQGITWTSSNDSKATVNTSGLVTGVAQGNITITATATDGGASKTHAVTVGTPPTELTWNFATLPATWPVQDAVAANTTSSTHTSDIDLGDGLMVNLFDNTDGRASRSSRFGDATNATTTAVGFSNGRIQSGGAGWFLYKTNVQGPFTLTFKYVGAGTGNRYPGVSVSGLTIPSTAGTNIPAVGDQSTGIADFKTWTYTYSGTDAVTVDVYASSGIRIHDLILAFQ